MALLKLIHHGLTVLLFDFLLPKSSDTVPKKLALIQPWSEWNISNVPKLSYFDHNDLAAKFDLTEQKLVLECTLKTDGEFDY